MARFPVTYCSSCGEAFGPGDHGFSHCTSHESKRPLTAREETAALSATEALRAAGYGQRPGRFEGKREVFNLSTGEVVGNFDAWQAWQFLRSLPASSSKEPA